jgi:hypothetical protein
MLGISLYSYLYLKLAKTLCLSYYLLCFLFNKIEEGGTGSARKEEGGGQTMYKHVSKCKNDKIKKRKFKKNYLEIPVHHSQNIYHQINK